MASIYKRGNSWYIDLYVKGRRIRKKVGKSKQVAELALKDAEVKAARDEFGFAKNDISIDKFLEKFEEYSRIHHTPSTYRRYRIVIDHLQAFLKHKPRIIFLSQIRAKEIDEYKIYRKGEWVNPNGVPVESEENATESTQQGAKAHTINFEIRVLRFMFNMAIRWDYIKENPTKDTVRLKVNDSKPPRFLTKEECRLLLENSPENIRPIFFTFLITGMRKAELENLEWSDIDFQRKKIKIRRKEFWQPKTGEREIPMNQGVLIFLRNSERGMTGD